MSKTIEIRGFVHVRQSAPGPGHEMYSFMSTDDMTQYGYAVIGPHTITFEVPDSFNPVAAEVDSLKRQKDKLREEFNTQIARINDRLTSVQAIEFAPTGVKE